MDVSGLFGALTGGGNVKIDIALQTPQNDLGIVAMDHHPSWKLHRNPFWRVKHPQGSNKQQPQPPQQQQQQQNFGGAANNMNNPEMNDMNKNNMNPNMNMNQNNMNSNMNMNQNNNNMMMGNNNMNMQNSNQYPQQPQMQMPGNNNPQFNNNGPPAFNTNPPELMTEGLRQGVVAYEASKDVAGVVRLRVPPGKKVEHLGIKVQFIGRIDMGQGVHEGRPNYDFVSLSKELAPPGILYDAYVEVPFLFKNMDKEHESYKGRNVAVRYFVKVVVERKFLPPITKEHDVWVQILGQEPTENEAIKMEVGIEDCLHIEFEYERRVFHLQDTIIGKIHFMLVRIKIKHMELAVIRRETSGEGVASTSGAGGSSRGAPAGSAVDVNNICTETQTLVKYEIMDGAPVKGEVIPVKLCLRGIPCDLTPTYKGVNNRFSVRYFLNLVLVDAEDRRYFKQQEIILWRKELG